MLHLPQTQISSHNSDTFASLDMTLDEQFRSTSSLISLGEWPVMSWLPNWLRSVTFSTPDSWLRTCREHYTPAWVFQCSSLRIALFDVISKGYRTAEKRLMLDISTAREGFLIHEISNIGFVRTNHNVSDGLTKPMQQACLREVLCTGRIRSKVDQWIIRRKPSATA